MEKDDLPIGINFIITNDSNQILLGRRANCFGAGMYSLVGGKLKSFETIEQCAIRELKEEIDLDVEISDLEVINLAMVITNGSWLQIGVQIKKYSGTPRIMEPNKCDDLRFFDLDDLPELFVATKPNVELFKKNKFY
ncbi:MAG: NUDIX domain-containing protein, partial [Oscillospiraceae bacterium]|nr:NUDIX domain-containing protein [Oscillospiraceae bacterium]